MANTTTNIPKELEGLPISNPKGEIRKISIIGTAIGSLLGSFFLGIILGFFVLYSIDAITSGKGKWLVIVVMITYVILWGKLTTKWFNVLRKGIVISSVHDIVILPASVNTFFAKIKFFFNPTRNTLKLSEIEKLYASEREVQSKDKNGNITTRTVYELHVAGTSNSIATNFGENRSKRDEVRNAIKTTAANVGIEIDEELDMYG